MQIGRHRPMIAPYRRSDLAQSVRMELRNGLLARAYRHAKTLRINTFPHEPLMVPMDSRENIAPRFSITPLTPRALLQCD
jgi:hypothetical protein